MASKKYRYKKEVAQRDGVISIDENQDGVPEALEIDGQRQNFEEIKEVDELEERPKGYEEVTEEETVSAVPASPAPEAHTEDQTQATDVHANTEVTARAEDPQASRDQDATVSETHQEASVTHTEASHVESESEHHNEPQASPVASGEAETHQPNADSAVSKETEVNSATSQDTPVVGTATNPDPVIVAPPASPQGDTLQPYSPPAESSPDNHAETAADTTVVNTPTQPAVTDTVTVESATGPAPGEEVVTPAGTQGGVGVTVNPATSSSTTAEQHDVNSAPEGRSLEGLLPEEMEVVEFAKSIRQRMDEYCRLMGPGVVQTEQSLVRNQLELNSIFMTVLYVSDVAKFEAGIKQIFLVINANKALCFDYSSRFRGITDIPASRMSEDEVETFTALIDLFCRLVSATDLYEVGRTYNFNTLQRHLTDQFVLSRFLGFVRRIVGAA